MQAIIDIYAASARKSGRGTEHELELRLQLRPEQWLKVYEHCKAKDPLETLQLSVVLLGEQRAHNSVLRREIYPEDPKQNRVVLKTRIARYQGRDPIAFKLVAATEEPKPWSGEPIKKIRIRRRASMVFGDWRWDFTVVLEMPGENIADLKKRKDAFAATPWPPSASVSPAPSAWELEVEWKGKDPPTEAAVKEVLNEIAGLIGDNTRDYERVIREVAALLGREVRGRPSLRSVVNQPVMLGINEYQRLDLKGWFVSDKADGERALLYFGTSAILVTSELRVLTLESWSGPRPLLVDAELVGETLYAFDVLYSSRSFIEESYSRRIAELDAVLKTLRAVNLGFRVEKKILERIETLEQIRTMYERKHRTYPIDGLVFTPDAPYFETVYKWKPPEQLTIDFLIKRPPARMVGVAPYEGRDGHEIYFLFANISYRLFKSLGLRFVRGYHEMFPSRGDREAQYFPIQFSPSSNPLAYVYYHPTAASAASAAADLDNKVGEFRYVPNKGWELVRMRPDKTTGNDFVVAEKTLAAVHNPLTLEGLCNPESIRGYFAESKSELHRAGAKFNSFVKAQVLRQLSGADFVVDLACGKGQDLFVYNGYGVRAVLFVDRDAAAIQELNRRRYEMNNPALYIYAPKPRKHLTAITKVLDISDPKAYEALKNDVPRGGAAAVVMNFALHYFAGSVESLRRVTTLVDSLLRPGGLFIFTCFDGASVISLLRKVPTGGTWEVLEGEQPKYRIRKDYEGDELAPAGQKIAVLHPFSQGELYEEYLVNFQQVLMLLPRYEVRQHSSFGDWFDRFAQFNPRMQLSEQDRVYHSLYYYTTLWKPE